jgi:hypothetical protein
VYAAPRPGLPVSPGTLLFSGKRSGNIYSGTAYVFSARCGARGYSVSGLVGADDRSVTLYGRAPLVDSTCKTATYRDDTLVFNLQEPITNPISTATQTDITASTGPTVNEAVGWAQQLANFQQAISNAQERMGSLETQEQRAQSRLESLEYDASRRLAAAERQAQDLIENAKSEANRIVADARNQAGFSMTDGTGNAWDVLKGIGKSTIPLNWATLLGGVLVLLLVGLHLLGQQEMSKLTRAVILAGAPIFQAVIAWLWGIKDEITFFQLPILLLPYIGVVGLSLGFHPHHVSHGRLH